ncbi:MAG: PGPGW domain-containing protein [Rhizobiaceae bacterium]
MQEFEGQGEERPARSIKLFGKTFRLPRSRLLRVVIGILLVIGGLLGFLPILGFWMIPLGLLVLSSDFAFIRRQRRRLSVWWERRRRRK